MEWRPWSRLISSAGALGEAAAQGSGDVVASSSLRVAVFVVLDSLGKDHLLCFEQFCVFVRQNAQEQYKQLGLDQAQCHTDADEPRHDMRQCLYVQWCLFVKLSNDQCGAATKYQFVVEAGASGHLGVNRISVACRCSRLARLVHGV
eukprot:1200345-Amphidinium_carterae.1